jgi:peptidoglycan hydrolase-like protein with peptidoglycan-binding domain
MKLLLISVALALAPAPMAFAQKGPTHATREMPPGMATAYVRGIQEELAAHGYSPGKADGVFGARTRGAIEEYQRDAGLQVTGEPSKQLLDHLKFAQPRVQAKGLQARQADTPQDVVIRAQQLLESRGYYKGRMDGHVGPEAREAARRFQADAGLPQTGVFDQGLLDQLNKADPAIRAPRS